MAVYTIYYGASPARSDAFDQALQERFGDVYRVSAELWLVDTGREADAIYGAMRQSVHQGDRLFIAEITRDFFPWLSQSALGWLFAPERSWKGRYVAREVAQKIYAAAA
ncbi:hypothetical protein [Amorphus orientalis]|uniref:Uncharacterized protein n=1 Tax=Amorphus orientalis TaxID=649198 RepID=A0AAE3VT58_9HYPH|nr:hypothetical protein [Amorphus orientalis]MDQ0317365.1 hypothetical protein [Amorphus orientalis]